jgi:hypothetical protein
MPTLAEQWVRQGEVKVLLRLIGRKFGPPSDGVRQRIEGADEDTLFRWAERVLDAESLEAVLD